jgi:rfaE bifunctional protein nucleotidyltransferase chain/domain
VTVNAHVAELRAALDGLDTDRLEDWGRRLAVHLPAGGRLLAAGNGGSAAEAQHLTAELVGRFGRERPPVSALALHAETSSLTAIGNDYGYAEVFARQVRAHGRAGDVLVVLSTSGRSENLLRAVEAAHGAGLWVWGLVGDADSPLATHCDEVVTVAGGAGPAVSTVQETHLVAVHLLCAAYDAAIAAACASSAAAAPGHGPRPGPSPAPHRREGNAPGPTGAARGPLVVLGDCLLDIDVDGRVERLMADAPAPVLDAVDDRLRPGGAGLAALLAARDGQRVVLVTALGRDGAGSRLAALLAEAGIEVVDLGSGGPTPRKIRLRSGGRTLLRLDRDTAAPAAIGPLPPAGRRALEAAGGVLVADYGRGVTGVGTVRSALAELARRIPVVWDPHPRGAPVLPGLRMVTPNLAEARRLTVGAPAWQARPGPGDAGPPDSPGHAEPIAVAAGLGRRLVTEWNVATVALTLGARGSLLVDASGAPPLVAPAIPARGGDSCGAGDMYAVTAATRLAAGALPSEAVVAATAAAGAFVAAGGAGSVTTGSVPTDSVTTDSVTTDSVTTDSVTTDRDGGGLAHVREVVRRTRAAGGVVVATGGCFDLLHAGHVAVLTAARRLGDCLVVCLNSDASVRRLKGAERPLVTESDRASVLRGLDSVDGVAVFDEDTPARLLRELRPDVFAKGGDYAVADLPEAAVVAGWGGQAVVLPYLEGRSTTSIIREAVRRGGR